MKVKAKTWLKHKGVWHRGGDEFEISEADVDALNGMVEITEAPVVIEEPEKVTKKRGRPKKAE